jgi:hypothetical protein
MIYLPCDHQSVHNGGWVEELHLLIGGRNEVVAIAPCRLLCSRAGRVYSWLATLTVVLHRKIVHEEVLRQLLALRYGSWLGFWSIPELMQTFPVFYQHQANRYYLLRDVVPFLPRWNRIQRKNRHRYANDAALQRLEPVYNPGHHIDWSPSQTLIPASLSIAPKLGGNLRTTDC